LREPACELLDWYDDHARVLPWRVPPGSGELADPYRVWLSEVMLQQTTVAAVGRYFAEFTRRWPRVTDLAAAPDAEVMAAWAGLGYYARARNLLKCARAVAGVHGGVFPDTREGLLALPGVGPYTAAAVAAIAFDRPETVVDGNVERVMSRLHAVETPMPAAKPKLRELAAVLTPQRRPGDYAQAVMDLGATVCTPRRPACERCPWATRCAGRAAGIAAELPRRTRKAAKPVRHGHAFVACDSDGAWLMERRPDRGLLGGMLGWPGSAWAEALPDPVPPFAADWAALDAQVEHTFTHFHLRLHVWVARLPGSAGSLSDGLFPVAGLVPADLPTAMRKVYRLAADWHGIGLR
jgi:A/G-specific adenine glycosylase